MRTKGFTIIEMMVTVAVIAVMMGLAMPSIGNWLANTRVRNTAEALQNGIQEARNAAVRRNKSVTFWLVSLSSPTAMDNNCKVDTNTASWVVSINSPDGKCGTPASTSAEPMIVTSHPAGDGGSNVSVAVTPDKATSVTFNGMGQVTNADAITQIDFTGPTDSGARALRIQIGAGGSPRVCDPAVTASGDARRCL